MIRKIIKKIILLLLLSINVYSYETKTIEKTEDIIPFNNREVQEIVYSIKKLNLNSLEVKEKKKEFINIILPSILIVKRELKEQQEQVINIKNKKEITNVDKEKLERLYKKYKVKNNIDELIKKLNTVPVEIAIAQAIIESGWGTSRFFIEGNNCYGAWTYRKDLPRIKSKFGKRNGKEVYLRKFKSVKESVENYFYNLAVSNNYKELRELLGEKIHYTELTKKLAGYSEKGEKYSEYLNNIIDHNKLNIYDKYILKNKEN